MTRYGWDMLFLVPLLVQVLALLWLARWYRLRRPLHDRPRRALIFRCTRCLKVYLDQRRVPLSRCPDCGLLNEPIKR